MTKQIFVDIEATGLSPVNDRICQLGIIKVDGSEIDFLINPQMPMPAEVIKLHGITDDMVKDAPLFEDIADTVIQALEEADTFVAYNAVFDFQFLQYELFRTVKYKLKETDFVFLDPYRIFKTLFPQNLANAYKFYTGKDLANAHSAIYDIRATKEILEQQIIQYPEFFKQAPKAIEEQTMGDMSILGKWFRNENGVIFFSQGKYKNAAVDSAKHLSYLKWIYGLEDITLSEKRYIEDRLHEQDKSFVSTAWQ